MKSLDINTYMKSSDAKASKCHCYWQINGKSLPFKWNYWLKYTRSIKIIILEKNFKWHLEAFVSELFIWKKEERFQMAKCTL